MGSPFSPRWKEMMVQFMVKPPEGLDDLLPFERLLTEISTLFINLPDDRIDNETNYAQSRIYELLDLDRSTVWVTSDNDPVHSWLKKTL
jgi:hypothetical protein